MICLNSKQFLGQRYSPPLSVLPYFLPLKLRQAEECKFHATDAPDGCVVHRRKPAIGLFSWFRMCGRRIGNNANFE